jgi:hypothetical protein
MKDALGGAANGPLPGCGELQSIGSSQRVHSEQPPRLRLDGLDIDQRVAGAHELVDASFGFGAALSSIERSRIRRATADASSTDVSVQTAIAASAANH